MKTLLTMIVAIAAISTLSARAADGKALYEASCAKCHGADGKGQTTMGKKNGAKDYSTAAVQDALTDAAAIKAITIAADGGNHPTPPLPRLASRLGPSSARLRRCGRALHSHVLMTFGTPC